jgi:molecular chaperone HtpG
MAMERGPLSINSENMFPIIKKWLYSDHDIFYRELISNGCDAITKLKKLDMMGDYELPEGYKARIDIEVSPQDKTIKVTDNGLGMTADEVKEYINNIAFSGAEAFMEKYKDKASDDQIIGHFGLGFYSAFMVAELVEIDTLSYQEGAKPVHWECDGGSTFAMDDGDRKEIGTTITLHLSEDCVEFANYYRAQEVIEKYCSFMPIEIYLSEHDTKMTDIINESERRPDDVVIEAGLDLLGSEQAGGDALFGVLPVLFGHDGGAGTHAHIADGHIALHHEMLGVIAALSAEGAEHFPIFAHITSPQCRPRRGGW